MNSFFFINIIKSNTWNKFESIHGYRQGQNHTIKILMKSRGNAQAEKARISNTFASHFVVNRTYSRCISTHFDMDLRFIIKRITFSFSGNRMIYIICTIF